MSAWEALLAFWLSLPPAEPYAPPVLPEWSGSVVRAADWHLGVRGHSDAVGDAAVTVQVTARALSL